MGIYWGWLYQKTMSFLYQETNAFSVGIQDWSGADQANWTVCRATHGSRAFGSCWISLKACILMPQTNSSLLQTSPKTISTGLVQYLIMSPGSASATLAVMPGNFICFMDATIHYVFNNILKTTTVVETDYGLINKSLMRPVLMVPVPVHVYQHVARAAIVKRRPERYPAATKHLLIM